jgi:protease I
MSYRSGNASAPLAKALAGASSGLGLAELAPPGKVAAIAGVDDTRVSRRVIRALGARECGHGAALLVGSDRLVWTRVAGDVLDASLLLAGVAARGPGRRRRGAFSAAVLGGIGAADLYAAPRATRDGGARHANVARHSALLATVTVRRPPEEVYGFWRDLENLPSFMDHLQSVIAGADGRSHWSPTRRLARRSSGTRRSPRTSRTGGSPGSPCRVRRFKTGAAWNSNPPATAMGPRSGSRSATSCRAASSAKPPRPFSASLPTNRSTKTFSVSSRSWRRKSSSAHDPVKGVPAMSNELQGTKVAILAADGVEKVELEKPRAALQRAGAQVEVLSLKTGEIQARNHDLEPAGTFAVDRAVSDASVDEFDGLILPGGTVNPDKLRLDGAAVSFVRDFVVSGKPVAAICHGPWTLVEAGVAVGRTVTSYPSIRTDLRNAGAHVVDEEVVVDGNLITSRSPADLPAFCETIIKQFAHATTG